MPNRIVNFRQVSDGAIFAEIPHPDNPEGLSNTILLGVWHPETQVGTLRMSITGEMPVEDLGGTVVRITSLTAWLNLLVSYSPFYRPVRPKY